MNGLEIMDDVLWMETVMAWLMQQAQELAGAGVECELTMRELYEEGIRPGLLMRGGGPGVVFFATLEPCETDMETCFLLCLSREKTMDTGDRQVQIWRFPLLLFPEPGPVGRDIFDHICLFETLREERGGVRPAGSLPHSAYEISRLNSLFDILGRMGADPELRIPDDGVPCILIRDDECFFRISCRLIDEEDETWILTAELFHSDSDQAEAEPMLRFDVPEFGGLEEPDAYGRLLEIMESLDRAHDED